MPETETVMINGHAVTVEKVITSGDLLVAMMMTISVSLFLAAVIIYIFGGRR